MRRRALLSTLAAATAALTGCSGLLTDEAKSSDGPLYIDGVDITDEIPASVTARIVSQPTDDDPGVWEVQLTNDDTTRRYRFSWPAPMSALVAEHVDPDARLYFQDPDSVTGRVGGCWTGDTTVLHAPPGTEESDLEPGRTIAFKNAVLAHPENEGCVPAGIYRVAERYGVYDERDEEWRSFDATFRLGVRE